MKVVLQRVTSASVTVIAEDYRAKIGPGLVILLGMEQGDTETEVAWGAKKCASLRIFNDDSGKMNLSVKDIGGSALVVSQFTLAADCRKGNRPSFIRAAHPEIAEPLYEKFCELLERENGVPVKRGIFQASMTVELANEGPVTIILERPPVSNSAD